MELFIQNLNQSLIITLFVFIMMILTDYINLLTKGRLKVALRGKTLWQYSVASFFGATPGCLGAYMDVSFYLRGLISFGALTGAMIATSGDEAFVMLAMFPAKAIILFVFLFIVGIGASYLVDKFVKAAKLKTCPECEFAAAEHEHDREQCHILSFREISIQLKKLSFERFLLLFIFFGVLYVLAANYIKFDQMWIKVTFIVLDLIALAIVFTVPDHYLEEHIWHHIFKQHLWKIFLWTFGTLLIIGFGLKYLNLSHIIKSNLFLVLIFAAVIGIIPESGPHLIFVTMYAKGMIPLSILVTSSIVQDGHGMLPLLAYSVKDSLRIKAINIVIGLLIGGILFYFGL